MKFIVYSMYYPFARIGEMEAPSPAQAILYAATKAQPHPVVSSADGQMEAYVARKLAELDA
jgi:hypothetical protein